MGDAPEVSGDVPEGRHETELTEPSEECGKRNADHGSIGPRMEAQVEWCAGRGARVHLRRHGSGRASVEGMAAASANPMSRAAAILHGPGWARPIAHNTMQMSAPMATDDQ